MDRRGFLGSLLAAPFVVRSGVLMPIKPDIVTVYGLPPPNTPVRIQYWDRRLSNDEIIQVFRGEYIPTPRQVNLIPVYKNGVRDYDTPVYVSGFVSEWIPDKGVFFGDPAFIHSWEKV